MKPVFFTLLFMVPSCCVFSQTDSSLQKKEIDGPRFERVEVEARYKGSFASWNNYVEENIRYPKKAKRHFAPGTEHRLRAKFVVERDGSITFIQIENDPGYGLGKEVIRLIKESGNWEPALQNGRVVKAFKSQDIVFKRPG